MQKAGSLYTQAGDVAEGNARYHSGSRRGCLHCVEGAALRLATAYTNFDPANGNAYDIASQSSDTMDVLCGRLAP